MYHFWVTVTLTSDLVFRIIVSGTNSKFGEWMHLGMVECLYPLRVTVTLNLTSDLVFRIIVLEHISYII